jgi:hypothetical protein
VFTRPRRCRRRLRGSRLHHESNAIIEPAHRPLVRSVLLGFKEWRLFPKAATEVTDVDSGQSRAYRPQSGAGNLACRRACRPCS